MKKIDQTGKRFGRLLVIRQHTRKGVKTRWFCQCDCGSTSVAFTNDLQSGRHQSCGCRQRESASKRFRIHGATGTTEYHSWMGMNQRCENRNHPRFKDYGGRGITVCKKWRRSFSQFIADMGRKPSPAHSLDRINNEAGYSPRNCRWATPSEQVQNQRRYDRKRNALGRFCSV